MVHGIRLLQLLVAVGFSVVMLLIYFNYTVSIGEKKIQTDGKSTYAYLDRVLCRKSSTYSGQLQTCPKRVVTVAQGGRMSNKIWKYAEVWAVARKTGLEPYVPTCIYNAVDKMYDKLFVKPITSIAYCPYDKATFANSKVRDWDQSTQNLMLPKDSIDIDTVLSYLPDFREKFVLKEHLVTESQKQLREIQAPPGATYVGMHVRRKEFPAFVKKRFKVEPAGFDFYESAMQIFEKKHPNIIFVIVSDDPYWCYLHFGYRPNVYVIGGRGGNSAEVDLAILSSCNHSIIDYGAFGCWGALMAGGDTIYYNVTGHYSYWIGKAMENWITF